MLAGGEAEGGHIAGGGLEVEADEQIIHGIGEVGGIELVD